MSFSKLVLVTGSCGLIGSEVSVFFANHGYHVVGIDSNHRAVFFGPEGDTSWVLDRLQREVPGYRHELGRLSLACSEEPPATLSPSSTYAGKTASYVLFAIRLPPARRGVASDPPRQDCALQRCRVGIRRFRSTAVPHFPAKVLNTLHLA